MKPYSEPILSFFLSLLASGGWAGTPALTNDIPARHNDESVGSGTNALGTVTCDATGLPPVNGTCPHVLDIAGSGAEGMLIVMLGGVDPSGNARPIAVDADGHIKCSPYRQHHHARYVIRNFPASAQVLATGIQVDRQGRAVCEEVLDPGTLTIQSSPGSIIAPSGGNNTVHP